MHRNFTIILAALLLLLTSAALGAEPDLSTPTSGMKAFYSAIAAGDVKTAQAACNAEEKELEFIKANIALEKAFAHLAKSAQDKFGKDGQKLNAPSPSSIVIKQLDQAKEKALDENTVEVLIGAGSTQRMTKQDGKWQVDLKSMLVGLGAEEGAKLFQSIATYIDETATAIDDGKLTTVTEVQQEIRRRGKLLDAELGEKQRKKQQQR
jgi:hypothetical protein